MLLSRWLKTVEKISRRPARSRSTMVKVPSLAEVETLEDRCLLATFVVNSLADTVAIDGSTTLREAINSANTNNNPSETDLIRFDPALLNTSRVITLTAGQIEILQSVSIRGPSFDPAGIVVSGNDSSRVYDVESTAQTVTMQFFTITRGSTSGDGGGLLNQAPNLVLTDMVISNNRANFGGGISNTNNGRLEIQRSQIISNSASSDGGGIDNFTGGTLIVNQSTIAGNIADDGGGVVAESGSTQTTITNSTISHNTASSGSGGGIANFSTTSTALTVQNSTIVGNLSTGGGGGISSSAGTVVTTNVTIANNFDTSSDGTGGAGGISRTGGGTVTGVNMVVAQNNSNSGNDNTNSGALNGPGTQANFIGGDPRLGPLQDNGGLTFTMLPLPGSPVLGNGVSAGTTLRDQRGFARNVSSAGNGSPSVDQGAVEFFPTITQPYAVAPGNNNGSLQKSIFDAAVPKQRAGEARFKSDSYPGFGGEVHVALADLNGDGTKDIITGPGPGGGPHIIVRNGLDPSQLLDARYSFFAFPPAFRGGVYVAAGDINGDGTMDIITGMASGGALVRVFDGTDPTNLLVELNPFAGFGGGVRVASGDIDGDGRADIVIAAGPGAGSHVVVFSGDEVIAQPNFGSLISGPLGSFFPYGGFGGGTFVATGDVNGDGRDDIITGAGAGGGPHVLAFTNSANRLIASFFAYGVGFAGGVGVGAVDFDGDLFDDIVTGAGPGGGPHVRIISGRILTTFTTQVDLQSFFPFATSFTGGVFVAGSKVPLSGGSPLRVAEGIAPPDGAVQEISDHDLAVIAEAAIERFAAAGASEIQIAQLQNASIEVAELSGDLLALTFTDSIVIDVDAAGFGFFVDLTPGDDVEFQTATGQAITEEARDRIDLLSVIAHEFAHVLGLPDLDSGQHPDHLLADRLAPGIRRFVVDEDLAALDAAFHPDSLDGLWN